MGTMLQKIADAARLRAEADKELMSLDTLKVSCPQAKGKAFEQALKKPGLSFICEIKRASPSRGMIATDFPYRDIAREYAAAGADCLSCLTEPKWFLGSDEIFRTIRRDVSLPMLRKDFIIDEYQLYQSGHLGAQAVLLICALLDPQTLAHYLQICAQIGLAAVVETHDETEIAWALAAGARIIGVNNRDLKDFSVKSDHSLRLRPLVPAHLTFIAESGIRTPEDIDRLRLAGVDAVLVGEALMRAPNKKKMLQFLKGEQNEGS